MLNLGYRLVAAAAVVTGSALSLGLGVAFSNVADKAPDLTELREAVSAAAKRGENVDEIRKAVDGLQKLLSNGWSAPAPGKTVEPPAELTALHDAVEAAARKGENVDEIRSQLEAVERAMLGKTLARPKPQPLPPLRPMPVNPVPEAFPRPLLPAEVPGFVMPGVDNEMMKKAQDLTTKATELLLRNPNDPEARKMLQEAQDMMLRAMLGGPGGFIPGAIAPVPGLGRAAPDRFRLGVRLERVSELAADQLNLDVARGVGISDVVEGSPAAKAGFKRFDIVLEFAGRPVSDRPEDFMQIVSQAKAGEKVDAVVLRKGKRLEIKGIEMPDAPQVFPRAVQIEPPFPPGGRRMEPGPEPRLPQRGGNSVAVSNVNGLITIKAVQNGVNYEIQGQQAADEFQIGKILIADGEKKVEAAKLDKVPDDYRPVVERLIKSVVPRNRVVPVRPRD